MSSVSELATDNLPCTHCGAQPGTSCVTNSGARASWPHSARTNPASAIWVDGYRDAAAGWTSAILRAEETSDWTRLMDWARREHRWATETP